MEAGREGAIREEAGSGQQWVEARCNWTSGFLGSCASFLFIPLYGSFRNKRLAEYDNGVAFLTSHRVLWIDDAREKPRQLPLSVIRDVDYSGGLWKASSPKVVLTLDPVPADAAGPADTNDSVSPAASSPVGTPPPIRANPIASPPWKCDICANENKAEEIKCDLCGAPAGFKGSVLTRLPDVSAGKLPPVPISAGLKIHPPGTTSRASYPFVPLDGADRLPYA
ncbi:hypothetical protein BDK51DRAFT_42462 [Blyttiomyces helicus]|uniref:RanBP2-type domain-containing protein n=1 Tax=Blyttiomyces helicus TaxID=388810 RepID=A0A4P9W6F1_9FUNG|nr:hypothetical protein BDK51DRAFT_42462 [Blyttiomyces helicus]|eukprot:RKO86508.1 hypothetical protein BDK51DRAFT_42462 [Blyttiomyces helicus]